MRGTQCVLHLWWWPPTSHWIIKSSLKTEILAEMLHWVHIYGLSSHLFGTVFWTPKHTKATHSRLVIVWFVFHTSDKMITLKRKCPLCKPPPQLPCEREGCTDEPLPTHFFFSPLQPWPTCCLLTMPNSLLSPSSPDLHLSIILQLPEQVPSTLGHPPQHPNCARYQNTASIRASKTAPYNYLLTCLSDPVNMPPEGQDRVFYLLIASAWLIEDIQ